MTVDLRAIVACDLGHLISGDVGSNHISDRSGLVMTQGRLVIDGIISPARGTAVNLLVGCPQLNRVTRFPKVLRVIRATAHPLDNRTEVEVGCRLALMKERKDPITYRSSFYTPPGWSDLTLLEQQLAPRPIYAQKVLEFCLFKIGVTLAASSRSLGFAFLRPELDLSAGYVKIIGDLIRSECCFGRLLPDETLQIVQIDISKGATGPVLNVDNLVSIEPITAGQEPSDSYIVRYSAAERSYSGLAFST